MERETWFREFVDQYGDRAFRYAFASLRHRQEAEDVAQEAFLRLWRHARRQGTESVTPALLFHTLTNLCRDRLRYQRRHPEDPTDLLETGFADRHDNRVVEEMAVLEAVLQLPLPERQSVLLFYYMDRSLKDIAEALHVSEQVVKTRLYRARQHLKPLLEPVVREGLL
ncbi:RNA polymerase sigma-70 factor, ECF subfamily [Candidatus Hydrogenisulfobacillus filiaventi]|uniref:RNA polymerase sigma-70 factor, ECF subfamily n=1 Tax=Candidatus Hydrogenisulfobacillus filiaventi TaxID=2707344 RepID=A0A6F8ZGT2_9FIRM|nr:RNA polymerase sigma factor [Bacillota bacterium]CAB1128846.1 RNA polymerase sigma-70 factor, ECF subfamily [Candidatus Hydrogenisulfobacillus filiaventi]